MILSLKNLGLDQLPVEDRLRLVEELWESVAANPLNIPLSEAQKVDLQRRLDEYQNHPRTGTPWNEVKARFEGQQ